MSFWRGSRHILGRIAATLMLTTSLTLASASVAHAVQKSDPIQVFADSGYTYCDAGLIAGLWQIDIVDAKAAIGMKIQNGDRVTLEERLAEARQSLQCEWEDLGLTYPDAKKLARVWGLPTPYDAKLKAAALYTQGRSRDVTAVLGHG